MTLLTRWIFGESDFFQLLRYGEVAVRSFFWGLVRRAALFVGHDLVTLPYVYPLARLRRRPIVYRAHELWAERSPGFPMAGLWRRLDLFFSPRVDGLVTPEVNRAAIYVKDYGAEEFPTVVYNCPELIPRPPDSPLKHLLREKDVRADYVVYYQGGIGATRSIDKLVEAMKEVPEDISLVLIGRPGKSFVLWFNDYVARNNLKSRALYLGFMPYGPQLFQLCAGADIGVMFMNDDCRNNRYSGTGANKLFEYMMMGLPILATDLQSYRDIVVGENIGVCVDSTKPHAIAEGIKQLHAHPERVREMRANGLRLASERYHWGAEAPKLLKLYAELSR